MVKKSLLLALLVTALSLGGVVSASATPIVIVNGSFEGGPAVGFATIAAPSVAIPGWLVSDGSVDWIGNYWQAQNGINSLDMNGLTPGTIQQDIVVPTAGDVTIDFWMAGNPDNLPFVKTLKVSLISADQFFTFDVTGLDHQNMGWENKLAVFTGISAGLWTLAFQGVDTDGNAYGAALDNVSASVASVPDGGMTAALLGLAMTGLGLVRRMKA